MEHTSAPGDYDDILAQVKIISPDAPTIDPEARLSLPTDALPEALTEFCRHIAHRRGVPVEVPLLSALTVAGAAAGAHVSLRMGGYVNYPSLSTMIVAESASGKSQPVKDVADPLKMIDNLLIDDYQKQMQTWTQVNASLPNPAPKPRKTQFICDTPTDAARMEFVCDNPRGGILYRDELRAFFKTLTGSFNDQAAEHAIEIADCSRIKIHLKGADEIKVADVSFLPILGTIQNAVLRHTIRPDFIANGLMQRFTPVVIDSGRFEISPQSGGIDSGQARRWRLTIESLRSLGNIVWEFRPSAEGAAAYVEEYERWCREFRYDPQYDDDYNDYRKQAYTKTLIAVHRLALIAHLLGITDRHPAYPHAHPELQPQTIRWAFACAPYIVMQKMKVYEMICGARHPERRADRDIIRDFYAMAAARGVKISQRDLANLSGLSQTTINRYLGTPASEKYDEGES